MGQTVTVRYGEARDYQEVIFAYKQGYFEETDNDAVTEKVDNSRSLIGFRS